MTSNLLQVKNISGNKIVLHREEIRKVLLVQPPAFTNNSKDDMNPNAPLGIAYIAAVLEKSRV